MQELFLYSLTNEKVSSENLGHKFIKTLAFAILFKQGKTKIPNGEVKY